MAAEAKAATFCSHSLTCFPKSVVLDAAVLSDETGGFGEVIMAIALVGAIMAGCSPMIAFVGLSLASFSPVVSLHVSLRSAASVASFRSIPPLSSGGDLAEVGGHTEEADIHLTGGQRRKLREFGKKLKAFPVADVSAAMTEVRSMLHQEELIKVELTAVQKKPDAFHC